jgi:hypothetical protein
MGVSVRRSVGGQCQCQLSLGRAKLHGRAKLLLSRVRREEGLSRRGSIVGIEYEDEFEFDFGTRGDRGEVIRRESIKGSSQNPNLPPLAAILSGSSFRKIVIELELVLESCSG